MVCDVTLAAIPSIKCPLYHISIVQNICAILFYAFLWMWNKLKLLVNNCEPRTLTNPCFNFLFAGMWIYPYLFVSIIIILLWTFTLNMQIETCWILDGALEVLVFCIFTIWPQGELLKWPPAKPSNHRIFFLFENFFLLF